MKILHVSQYFFPEIGAASTRGYEIATEWVKLGHEVTILTGFPNFPTGKIPDEYRRKMTKFVISEEMGGLKVIRTLLYPTSYGGSLKRVLNYISFLISASATGSFLKKPDLVIATSPPLLVGLAGYWISKIKGVPFIFEVRDLWPESLIGTGVGDEDSYFYRVLEKISMFLYRESTKIVVVTDGFKEVVSKKGIPPAKIEVVKNGVDPDLFKPFSDTEEIKSELGLQGKFVVSYIGTIGLSHGIEEVLKAAKFLRTKLSNAVLLIVGEGPEKEKALRIKEDENLSNVIFFDGQPKERVPFFINASDVCLVPLIKTKIFNTRIPAKIFEIMACAKPIILTADGEARKIVIEEAKAGLYVEPGKVEDLVKAILHLHGNSNFVEELGKSGREFVVKNFSRDIQAKEYCEILNQLLWSKSEEG